MKKWAAVENAFGDWKVTKGFETKKAAVEFIARNSCTIPHVKRQEVAGEYDVLFWDGTTNAGFVCHEGYLEINGYTNK